MQERKTAQAQVGRNDAKSRYEAMVGDELAGWADYRQHGERVHFTHTQVQQAYEGQGLGSRLVAQALDDVRRRGLEVVAKCPFVAAYVKRHEEEYADLLAR